MKKINNKKKYALGSYANVIGTGGNFLGQAIGGDTGNAISGIASGAAMGAALGPIGAGVGGLIGGAAALFGNSARKKAEAKQKEANRIQYVDQYNKQLDSDLDTNNENPYGDVYADGGTIHIKPQNRGKFTAYKKRTGKTTEEALHSKDPHVRKMAQFAKNAKQWKHADGGDVIPDMINIEKGELQIDPQSGKILREYTGINPETGGLYEPHSKGEDTDNNIVTAQPGTFIVTKKLAKDYKNAVDQNDKLKQTTILQNIKNFKDSKNESSKMAYGSYVDPTKPPYQAAQNPDWNMDSFIDQSRGLYPTPQVSLNPSYNPATIQGSKPVGIAGATGVTPSTGGFNIGNALNGVMDYAPSLFNIGKGIFGKVDTQQHVTPIQNPYKSQILNNMPQDVNINPLVDRLYRNQNTQFNNIDNSTSASPVARANKNNVFANTQNQLPELFMQQKSINNQVRGQRASIYGNLGAQDMQEQSRAQQLNLGIDENNRANRAAKDNLLSTGLGQLQQVFQNNRLNKSKQGMDKYKVDLLQQMFPNLKYYGNQFGQDALNKLIGG